MKLWESYLKYKKINQIYDLGIKLRELIKFSVQSHTTTITTTYSIKSHIQSVEHDIIRHDQYTWRCLWPEPLFHPGFPVNMNVRETGSASCQSTGNDRLRR